MSSDQETVLDNETPQECTEVTELPQHLAAKTHAPYDEKPAVQVLHESLTDETPTGYAAHKPCDEVPLSGEQQELVDEGKDPETVNESSEDVPQE